jgi:hypothetical protein
MADESLSPTPATILVHAPSSEHPSLAEGAFDRSSFMGKWGVAWSTLNMWKVRCLCPLETRRYNCIIGQERSASSTSPSIRYRVLTCYPDVTITYTPIQSGDTKFEDLVEYRKESASEGSKPSTGKYSHHPK